MVVYCPVETSLEVFFKKYPDMDSQNAYAVAVSGGPDSMALMHAIYLWAVENNKVIHVLTVDHGLRAEAKDEAVQVGNWIDLQNSKNLLHKILKWEGAKPDSSIMEVARVARYELMANYCSEHKIKTLFIAHHQDDQAETFLIRLAKGSGLDGLASMNELQKHSENISFARPFLDISKQSLIEYCNNKMIKFVIDPSNENENYLRPRLRGSMSVLEKEGLSAKRLSNLTRRLRRARQALEKISEYGYQNCLKERNNESIVLDFKKFQDETEEIAFRIIKKTVTELRNNEGYGVRMDRLENLFNSLWWEPESFKPRTLGGLIFALKGKNSALYIMKE